MRVKAVECIACQLHIKEVFAKQGQRLDGQYALSTGDRHLPVEAIASVYARLLCDCFLPSQAWNDEVGVI